jgi:NAD(P)-dependent dehydrogenase (short-subunit alcohol dehydrogenase family)
MSQQSVLITGCSDDGIGYGLALTFQQRGYLVFATTRDIKKMSKLDGLPDVVLLALDVTQPDQIAAAVKAVSEKTGGTLDYLINNAGRNHFMPILDEDLNKTRAVFETNVWGPVAITQAFAPLLIKAKGQIVFTTSISGYVNVPWMGK